MGGNHLDRVPNRVSNDEYHCVGTLTHEQQYLSKPKFLFFRKDVFASVITWKALVSVKVQFFSNHHLVPSETWIQLISPSTVFMFCLLLNFISCSPGPCPSNIWWLLIWPVSSASLFLFLYFLAMTRVHTPQWTDSPLFNPVFWLTDT